MPPTPTSAAALRLLRSAARTRSEVVDRLVRAGHDRAEAQRVAADLAGKGIIDEGAIAAAEVRDGVRAGRARSDIERRLRERGVEDSAIRRALGDEQVGADADRAALEAGALARRAGGSGAARLRRVLAGLARRGYDEDTAREAARRALGPIDDGPET